MWFLVLAPSLVLPAGEWPQAGDPMVVTCGNDVGWQVVSPEAARASFLERGELRRDTGAVEEHWARYGHLYGEHGVTAFEPYVKWMLMEPREGEFDPSFYDAELAAFKAHGLKWVPFLVAGPAYATPPWLKESDRSVFAVDIATGHVSRDQSIWNPHLRPLVRAWLERFFAHYVHDDMQAVLLGISGVFGESIFTAGGNAWTQIWDGEYPQHFGWWCGDEYARASFRAAMSAKYATIADLNAAWQTDLAGFDEVEPFVPDVNRSDRARLDMIRWYMQSMTDYAEWWVSTTRELAPTVPVLLCTGGGAEPQLGADMSAQTKMVARYGAGMRITNEASDYAANFHITRHISSAARLYGTYFGYEPAGEVSEDGIVARIYNAVAAGAWELFHYDNPPDGARGQRYRANLDLLARMREPVVEAGLLWPRTSMDLGLAGGLGRAGTVVRDLCDIDYVDELMVADGALKPLKLLVWGAGPVVEADTAAAIEAAVRDDGLAVVVPRGWQPRDPEGNPVFPAGHTTPAHGYAEYSVPELPDGPSESSAWREGVFHGPEPDSVWGTGGSVCWTGGDVTLHVPVPATECRITLPYWVGQVPGVVRVFVDGELHSEVPPNRRGTLEIHLPEATAERWVAVRLRSGTWVPQEAGGGPDTRHLAVMLRDVAVEPVGERPEDEEVATVHRVGRGTVLEAVRAASEGIALVVEALLRDPEAFGVAPLTEEARADGKRDGLYLAVTTTDVLLYNHTSEARAIELGGRAVEVPGHAIVSVPRSSMADGR
ncbi:MAG TPA: beta-galactosidase [Armatimonadota bacterium]|nr:beta-galactosidase [Armatimonadota bacterium]